MDAFSSNDAGQGGDTAVEIEAPATAAVAAASAAQDTPERRMERRTLSLRRVVPAGQDATENATSGTGPAIPLKRLTAGRKELCILHDGATYLLRVTKSNKLILTKA